MRIGFEVKPWRNIAFSSFTDEELIEYYYKLRLGAMAKGKTHKDLGFDDDMADLYVVELQDELLRRMREHGKH